MGKKILVWLRFYKVGWLVASLVIIGVITTILKKNMYYTTYLGFSLTPSFKASCIGILLFLVVIKVYSIYIKSKIYQINTGRSYPRDFFATRMKWRELLNFYIDADPYRIDERTLPFANWRDSEGIIFGKTKTGRIVKRDTNDKGNVACFALPGGGKTSSQIIPTAICFGGSVFAIDIKGDIYNAAKDYRRIKLFDPENPDISWQFNPLEGIEDMSLAERVSYISNTAITLIPEEGDKSKYFTDGGRDFFCGITLYLLAQDLHTSFPSIVKAIVNGNYADWVRRIKDSDCNEAKEFTDSYFGTNEANVAGAYGTAVKRLRPLATGNLYTLLGNDKDSISPKDLDEGIDIYIRLPQEKIQLYAPITTLMVQMFTTAFMQRPDETSDPTMRPIVFLLDEFHQLNFDLDTITSSMATLRSKKVTLFISLQSIAQLETRYGKAGARQIIDCCAYISVMGAQEPESRKFFADLIGTRKVLKVSTSKELSLQSRKKNRSIHESEEPIFKPADFGHLNDDVVVIANGKYIRAKKTYHFK